MGQEAGPSDHITWLPTGYGQARDEKKFRSAWAGNRMPFFWKDMSLMREHSSRTWKQATDPNSAPLKLAFSLRFLQI